MQQRQCQMHEPKKLSALNMCQDVEQVAPSVELSTCREGKKCSGALEERTLGAMLMYVCLARTGTAVRRLFQKNSSSEGVLYFSGVLTVTPRSLLTFSGV